ncbi:MAG: class I mannose-6-phosphate isomerase [Treponema sp.]|nr:class I mannose-6-phosphate isomerase [Treponema sp.]MBP5753191.1 class I mannose-6-phosphate isomerase [Treponema sp.]
MLKLNHIVSEKIWGYELWKASTHPNGCQKELLDFAGGDYPLLVKVIQADDVLSVQVHPDDIKARELEGCRGKTECWYILDAKEDSRLIYGMNGNYSEEEIKDSVRNNSLEERVNSVPVSSGDFAYIPAGTVHAIGSGIRLLEIQQSSDITYRLYDWGRGRECHLDKAVCCIKNLEAQKIVQFGNKFDCPYFSLEKLSTKEKDSLTIECHENDGPLSTALIFVLDGEGTINGENAGKEDIFAFKSGESIQTQGKLVLMKIIPYSCKS